MDWNQPITTHKCNTLPQHKLNCVETKKMQSILIYGVYILLNSTITQYITYQDNGSLPPCKITWNTLELDFGVLKNLKLVLAVLIIYSSLLDTTSKQIIHNMTENVLDDVLAFSFENHVFSCSEKNFPIKVFSGFKHPIIIIIQQFFFLDLLKLNKLLLQ